MGMRFRKSIRLGKGVRVNFSKSGVGLGIGGKGLSASIGPSGRRASVGIPGSGLSYEMRSKRGKAKTSPKTSETHGESVVTTSELRQRSADSRSSREGLGTGGLIVLTICLILVVALAGYLVQ